MDHVESDRTDAMNLDVARTVTANVYKYIQVRTDGHTNLTLNFPNNTAERPLFLFCCKFQCCFRYYLLEIGLNVTP